jgi:TonB family protein
MNTHLTDEQITEWLLDYADDEVLLHLRRCAACRDEAHGLHQTITDCTRRLNMDNFGSPLTLLPDSKLNWRSLLTSYGMQAVALLILLNLGFLLPSTIRLVGPSVAEAIQVIDTRRPEPVPARLPKVLPRTIMETPKYEEPSPQAISLPVVRPAKPLPASSSEEVTAPEVRAPEIARVLPLDPEAGNVRVVHSTPALAPAAGDSSHKTRGSAAALLGDLFGVPSTGAPGAKLLIARVGSPFGSDQAGGDGRGVGGGHRPGRGTLGFVSIGGIAIGSAREGGDGGTGRKVVQASFAPPPPVTAVKPISQVDEPKTTAAKIISKPTPEYTEEARQLKIEGEVVLQVAFLASGELEVLSVVRGLGHGLDEAAIRAVRQMKFNPATNKGQPVDTTAMIHVVFQLAY